MALLCLRCCGWTQGLPQAAPNAVPVEPPGEFRKLYEELFAAIQRQDYDTVEHFLHADYSARVLDYHLWDKAFSMRILRENARRAQVKSAGYRILSIVTNTQTTASFKIHSWAEFLPPIASSISFGSQQEVWEKTSGGWKLRSGCLLLRELFMSGMKVGTDDTCYPLRPPKKQVLQEAGGPLLPHAVLDEVFLRPRMLALSANGALCAVFNPENYTVTIASTEDGRWRTNLWSKTAGLSHSAALKFSPSGRWLAVGMNGGVKVWDMATLSFHSRSLFSWPWTVDSLAFSPDESLIAVAQRGDALAIAEVETGSTLCSLTNTGPFVSFTNDRSSFTTAHGTNWLTWSTHGGQLLNSSPKPQPGSSRVLAYGDFSDPTSVRSSGQSMNFSPNGRFVAVVCNNGNIALFDARTKALVQLLRGFPRQGNFGSVMFSADESVLAAMSFEGEIALWKLPPRDGASGGK